MIAISDGTKIKKKMLLTLKAICKKYGLVNLHLSTLGIIVVYHKYDIPMRNNPILAMVLVAFTPESPYIRPTNIAVKTWNKSLKCVTVC